MKRALAIQPADTMMFRDGRPFNQNDAGAAAAESLFPPPLPTLVGAVRAALFEQLASGGGEWPVEQLGNGVDWQAEDGLGKLSFGPLLLRGKSGEIFYPMPSIVGHDKCSKNHMLFVDDQPKFESDLGSDVVFLTAPPGEFAPGFKPYEGAWLSQKGMEDVLRGQVPDADCIRKSGDVFERETKVGIGINSDTRIVNDAQLYTAGFIRLDDDYEMLLPVDGLPDSIVAFTQRLGGEQRTAHFTSCQFEEISNWPHQVVQTARYAAVSISPVYLNNEPKPGSEVLGLPGRLVTAAIPKPIMLGGWDSRKRGPLPMMPIVPAGAVFLMECDQQSEVPSRPIRIGHAQHWGFGHCLIGEWPTAGGQGK